MPTPAVTREGLDDELEVEVELPPDEEVRGLEDVAAADALVAFIKR